MDNLSKDLGYLCRRHRDGSHGTQNNRELGLKAMARQINSLGYKLPHAQSLKPKHVEALLEHWRSNDLDPASIRNRLSWLRWWAEKINKQNVVARDNNDYGVAYRQEITLNRAKPLDEPAWQTIECPLIQASLLLQVHFGLRREEAIKFQPSLAIKPDGIALKASWCKGGRARDIPINNARQRHALQQVLELAGIEQSLIPRDKTYVQQLKRYEHQTLKAGLRNTHGFRHKYAQDRYLALTGQKCPLAGGKHRKEMTQLDFKRDRAARLQISKELGHNRLAITDVYLGRA